MEDATPDLALSGFNTPLNVIKALQCQNLTFGDSEQITHYLELTTITIARLFFDWHRPCPCSTCENVNGLLPYHLPKGTGSSVNIWEELDAVPAA